MMFLICKPVDTALPRTTLWKRLGQAFKNRFPVVKERLYYLPADQFAGQVGDVVTLHDFQVLFIIGTVDIGFTVYASAAPENDKL